jgi:hypothetical protein
MFLLAHDADGLLFFSNTSVHDYFPELNSVLFQKPPSSHEVDDDTV